jgi:hypothetical protein
MLVFCTFLSLPNCHWLILPSLVSLLCIQWADCPRCCTHLKLFFGYMDPISCVFTALITMVWFITDCGFSQLLHWPTQRLVWAVSKSWQSLWVLHNLAPVFPLQTLLITLQLGNRLLLWLSICQSQ